MSAVAADRTARAVFIVSVLVTAALYTLPELRPVAYPLTLLSTLAHEMGHGLAALLVGGNFVSFEMYSDASGVSYTAGVTSPMGRAAVAAGGLVGPALAAAAAFMAGKRPGSARFFLGLLCFALLAALLLVVRNVFGGFFVGGLAFVLGWVVFKAGPHAAQMVLLFLGTQLGLSVYSRSDYLFTPVAQTNAGRMPSDVSEMASVLVLPYWFWGIVCGAVSAGALYIGARALWKSS
jgi:hypothetical protein